MSRLGFVPGLATKWRRIMIKQRQELTEVLERVQHWPPALRISLARRLLESVDTSGAESAGRGWSAADAIAAVNSRQPAPDDDTRPWNATPPHSGNGL
jgi:hypothetical protein